MKIFLSIAAVLFVLGFHIPSSFATPPPNTFLTNENGVLHKNGRPYRAVGYNFYTPFTHASIAPRDYVLTAIEDARQERVKVFRLLTHETWVRSLLPWITSRDTYWYNHRAMMQKLFATGADLIGRIEPLVFWELAEMLKVTPPPYTRYQPYTVYPADIARPDSDGFRLFALYLRDLVTIYKDCPQLIAWELGNEWDHLGNVSKEKQGRYTRHLGAARFALRDGHAALTTTEDWLALSRATMALIRERDPSRLIFPGYGGPREWEWNMWQSRGFKTDTEEQFLDFLGYIHDLPGLGAVGVHFYNTPRNHRFGYSADAYDPGMLALYSRYAATRRLPVYVGEFGDTGPAIETHQGVCPWTRAVIEYMKRDTRVQIACVWAWYPAKNPDQDPWRMEKYPAVRRAVREANNHFSAQYAPSPLPGTRSDMSVK